MSKDIIDRIAAAVSILSENGLTTQQVEALGDLEGAIRDDQRKIDVDFILDFDSETNVEWVTKRVALELERQAP